MTTEERKRTCPLCGETMETFRAKGWELPPGFEPWRYWHCRCGHYEVEASPDMPPQEQEATCHK